MNYIMCNHCKQVIRSKHRHDMKWCSCGKVAIDGGNDYVKVSFTDADDFMSITNFVLEVDHEDVNGFVATDKYEGDRIIVTTQNEGIHFTYLFTFTNLVAAGYNYKLLKEL